MILVGEIRDLETAQIAVQAALTGHMVFSTLHTNDAPSTITRLRDMGRRAVPDHGHRRRHPGPAAGAQDLRGLPDRVRAEPRNADGTEPEARGCATGKKFYYGRGCDRCNNTGYKGRMGLYEC